VKEEDPRLGRSYRDIHSVNPLCLLSSSAVKIDLGADFKRIKRVKMGGIQLSIFAKHEVCNQV
jgi:hypothetical protein